MAHDLLSGKQGGRDWSRGDGLTERFARRAVESVEKKIPWVPIGIGTAVVGLFFLLPSGKKTTTPSVDYHTRRRSRVTRPTLQIPHVPMRELQRSGKKD